MRRFWLGMALVTALVCVTGCRSIGYYSQAVKGQCEILSKRRSVESMLADPKTPETLKERFRLIQEMRQYAQKDLGLPVKGHYSSYVDLNRPYVVWNVHAAPEFSLQPKAWNYPVVGRLKYRGYFSEKDARAYAKELEAQGYDVHVEGVEAYSTLGWFTDPLLNTFVNREQSQLAETIFHELSHQRLFVSGDTDFSEAFATAVSEEAVRRWLESRGDSQRYSNYLASVQRNEQFVKLIQETRAELKGLYQAHAEREPKLSDSTAKKELAAQTREKKKQIIAGLRNKYSNLKTEWSGYSGYDRWFAKSLSNAQLNTVSAYYDLVPTFHQLLHHKNGDLEKFFTSVQEIARLSKEARHRQLAETAGPVIVKGGEEAQSSAKAPSL